MGGLRPRSCIPIAVPNVTDNPSTASVLTSVIRRGTTCPCTIKGYGESDCGYRHAVASDVPSVLFLT